MTNREEIQRRRTFAIISHPDAGKTTLTEKLLLYGGAINQAGSVKGKQSAKHAVSDWMDIEKQRGISVTSSVLQFNFAGKCVNILDTPGHQDFSEDTYRTLMAADSAVMVIDAAKGVEFVVRLVIRFAPVGIFGLVANTFATTGAEVFIGYIQLLVVLLGSMFFVALVINPFLVWFCTHKNPFPVTLMTLRESGVAAFFTRSSAANIPVNLEICRRLGLPESTYSISIPVGATINMAGAAITITVLTLSAAYSLNIPVDLGTAVFLSFVASICACGASGVPGGSLMLIPLACGLFGIDQNTAMQVVAVGFIIGVLQDSCETALNSSSDALFTIAACQRAERLERGE